MDRTTCGVFAALAAGAYCAPFVCAGTLDLATGDPDVVSQFIDVDYDATTDQFSAVGFAFELDDDGIGPALPIAGGGFSLQAMIDGSGALVSGTISITGTVGSLGFNSGTLLTGTLTDFGFPGGGGDPLEFLFDVTGGDLMALYAGLPGGVVLTGTSFPGSWDSNWTNSPTAPGNGTAVADAGPVPTPASLALFGVAGLAVAGRRR